MRTDETTSTRTDAPVCFLDRVLDPPAYGFSKDGALVVPTKKQLWAEFGSRLNVFRSRKNWLPFFAWTSSLLLAIPLTLFFTYFFSWPLLLAGFVYSMICMGTHGTIWLHRYSTHRAYTFRNPIFRTIARNLVIRQIPEEVYVISHHVHHRISEKPGDPYNVHGGWLYCFLADANHQNIARNLTEKDYRQLCKLMEHTGVKLNSYQQYQKWGTLSHPFWSVAHYVANWAFWYGAFYLLGGHPLAICLFGSAGVWGIGVRTYNYDGHGAGKDRRQVGIDFNRDDLSVNQIWPGYVAGEWHNNHHLYPNGARSGFLPYQIDFAWYFIRAYRAIGGITTYKDYKAEFLRDYYEPFMRAKESGGPEFLEIEKANRASTGSNALLPETFESEPVVTI